MTKTGHLKNKKFRTALAYEIRWRGYLEFTHNRFISNLKLSSGDRILDVSCGTGLLAKKLTDRNIPFDTMVLNDVSAEMQRLARERFQNNSDITFTNYPAEEMGFPDDSFTSIFCLNAFHCYHNQRKAMSEFGRLLRPGGQALSAGLGPKRIIFCGKQHYFMVGR